MRITMVWWDAATPQATPSPKMLRASEQAICKDSQQTNPHVGHGKQEIWPKKTWFFVVSNSEELTKTSCLQQRSFFCTVNLYLCEMCFLPQIGRVSTNTVVDVTNTNWDPHQEDLGFSKVLMPADKQGIDQRRVGVSKSNILDITQQNWYLVFPSCSHLFNHSNYNPNLIGSAANCWIMKLGQAKSRKSLAEVPAVPAVPAVGGANLKRYNWNGEWSKTYGNLYICMGYQQNNQHIYIYIL